MKKAKKIHKQIVKLEHEEHDEKDHEKMVRKALEELRKHIPTRRISFIPEADGTRVLIHDIGFELTDDMAKDIEKEINKD